MRPQCATESGFLTFQVFAFGVPSAGEQEDRGGAGPAENGYGVAVARDAAKLSLKSAARF
jgi:hypothetical protein